MPATTGGGAGCRRRDNAEAAQHPSYAHRAKVYHASARLAIRAEGA